jgi:hypothetical protein
VSKRTHITHDFFSVAPQLIGLPLASPSRRAFAMAIDGLLVVMLIQAGGVFLGLAAVFVLFRASRRGEQGGFIRNSVRLGLRLAAAVVLFAVIMTAWNFGEDKINDNGNSERQAESNDDGEGNLTLNFAPGEALAVGGAVAGLARANEPEEVTKHARTVLEAAKRAGATASDLRESRAELIGLMGDDANDANIAALDTVLIEIAGTSPAQLSQHDSLLRVVKSLQTDVSRLDSRNDSLRAALERARESRGLRTFIGGVFDDLGLGFGWAAVFFTAFLAMMRGQTPGKRIMGLRVIRLDGKPLGWWISFERFGGYAASFSVGLLGFLQILWDRNRQGLHDKACETVVIVEKRQPARS